MLAVSAIATGLGWLCQQQGWLRIGDAERQAYDQGLRLFAGEGPAAEHVVVLGIDDATLQGIRGNPSYAQTFGTYPYARTLWARIFSHLKAEGARAIVFDAVMDERASDEGSDWALATAIAHERLPLTLGYSVVAGGAPLPAVDAINRLPSPPAEAAATEDPRERDAAPDGRADAPAQALPIETRAAGRPRDGVLAPFAETADAPGATAVGDGAEPLAAFEESPDVAPEAALDSAGLVETAGAFDEHRAGLAGDTAGFAEAATGAADPLATARALAFPVIAKDLALPRFATRDAKGEVLAQHPVSPIPALLPVVPGFGLVSMEEDPDGLIRRTRFAYTDGSNTYVTLPVAAVADLVGAGSLRLSPGVLELGDTRIPINQDGSAALDFGGPWRTRFSPLSVLAVLEDSVRRDAAEDGGESWRRVIPEGTFRDKVVLVGGMSVGTSDVRATPLESQSPGMVKHAVILEGLLGGGFILHAPMWLNLLITFLISLLSMALILGTRATLLEVAWPVALFLGFVLVTGAALHFGQLHLLNAMPVYAGELATLSAIATNHLFANRDREHLRQAFSRYLTPSLVDELVEQQRLPTLDGEAREISAFFSDIRGFSSFSERYRDDPRGLVKILNRYLTRVSDVLLEHGACLDKYIGDAVVCLFGAPIAMEDHALRACRGALAVRDAVAELRTQFAKEGLPDVYTRIGVNSAQMFVGNFGSEQLLDYTAIGDGMNLAARLEGANKAYGTLIMIGQRTRELAGAAIEVRELDRVRVAGKSEAVVVYELLALAGEATAAQRTCGARYAEGLALWRARRFEQAAQHLEAVAAAFPDDGPTQTLLARCRVHAKAPPEHFDGVVDLEK